MDLDLSPEEREIRDGDHVQRGPRQPSSGRRAHTPAGVELTELTKERAGYIGVDVAGPYKPDHYRY